MIAFNNTKSSFKMMTNIIWWPWVQEASRSSLGLLSTLQSFHFQCMLAGCFSCWQIYATGYVKKHGSMSTRWPFIYLSVCLSVWLSCEERWSFTMISSFPSRFLPESSSLHPELSGGITTRLTARGSKLLCSNGHLDRSRQKFIVNEFLIKMSSLGFWVGL